MVPYKTEPGKTPRKIKIERKKRLFLEQDIAALLRNEGVDYSKKEFSEFHLPLEYFDDTSFDPRTPEEWLSFRVCNLYHI
jgi:dynein heavy chain